MTHNHTHDADLIAAIDRLLNQGTPTGHLMLDDLAATVPHSRPAYERELEARLVAQLQVEQSQERTNRMQQVLRFPMSVALPKIRTMRPAYSLIAAVLAVALFAVGLFVVSNLPPSGSTPGAVPPVGDPDHAGAQASPTIITLTATPVPVMVVAYEYVVQPGDDCVSITSQFGHTSPDAVRLIVSLNNLESPCVLPAPGTTILVPMPTAALEGAGEDWVTPMRVEVTPTPLTSHQLTATSVIEQATARAAAQEATAEAEETVEPGPQVIVLTATPIAPQATIEGLPPMPPPIVVTVTAERLQPTFVPVGQFFWSADLRLVWIAAQDLPEGTRLGEGDIFPTYWPASMAPGSALREPLGWVIATDIAQWQPILVERVRP